MELFSEIINSYGCHPPEPSQHYRVLCWYLLGCQCGKLVTTVLAIPFIITNVVLTNTISLSNSDNSEEIEECK